LKTSTGSIWPRHPQRNVVRPSSFRFSPLKATALHLGGGRRPRAFARHRPRHPMAGVEVLLQARDWKAAVGEHSRRDDADMQVAARAEITTQHHGVLTRGTAVVRISPVLVELLLAATLGTVFRRTRSRPPGQCFFVDLHGRDSKQTAATAKPQACQVRQSSPPVAPPHSKRSLRRSPRD
jgi:hypothetical protein